MKITIDANVFATEQQIMSRYGREGLTIVKYQTRLAAFRLQRRIKIQMPVDTGRARASWGHSTPPASPDDGIWIESNNGLTYEQGSRVEYIGKLNEGHSKQAPAGFIDAAVALIQEELVDRITDDLARAFK